MTGRGIILAAKEVSDDARSIVVERRTILASVWLVIIILGIPAWIWTTEIERLGLPAARIARYSSGSCPVQLHASATPAEASIIRAHPQWHCIDTTASAEAPTWLSKILTQSREHATAQDARVVDYAPRYKLVYSLLLQETDAPSDWPIQSMLRNTLPLLESLNVLHNFTLETQVQSFAPLTFEPLDGTAADGEAHHIIEEYQLKAFVNTAEWNLATAASLDPVLHFILFVPSERYSPLKIRLSDGSYSSTNAFVSPQWGGVVLADSLDTLKFPEQLNTISQTFDAQLALLLGVPGRVRSGHRLEDWQVDAMLLTRTLANTRNGINTLKAIVNLTNTIENMPIGSDVQTDVTEALHAVEMVQQSWPDDLTGAMKWSAKVNELSSRAFYHPSMLGLLYFPDEHKYAVYTPLFGPIAVPLVLGIIKEFKSWRQGRAGRDKKTKKD
ncbi:uncharacterized protein L969DRAFT_86660 [Mixia osmundae IAM 14324]|uniref:GPI transamidase component PIG-S n=1 Tax=Mixia osmundae (strain CBS 9802 / IAM 14324 / JCM 22182 / KY 12970) TaxID=764103 RepID=G7E9U4_MIXOS|nr:uncharacterized protein L969DRAFT_86660 [Mixia osmundae IAM 14324]KEI40046.1 hypothetical protein L969DRAFT_86660 [Mixia osmundae IAM 14324]GAA99413.1 hypothetical protein E5Q_06111 [Mixia osmundae IAM 14324]